MATYYFPIQSSSQRPLAMVLALAAAVTLSPLYIRRKSDIRYYYDASWSSGFVLPMVLAALIIAIRTTSIQRDATTRASFFLSPDPSWVLRIGSSSWGLAGVLLMLVLVLTWQESVKEFFWR